MKFKTTVVIGLSLFGLVCAALIADAVFHHPQKTKQLLQRVVPLAGEAPTATQTPAETPAVRASEEQPALTATQAPPATELPELLGVGAKRRTVTLGAVYDEIERFDDPDKYKFQVTLTNEAAAVQSVTLSEFAVRGVDEPAHLVLLSPITNGKEVTSLANTAFLFAFNGTVIRKPYAELNWELVSQTSDSAVFRATLGEVARQDGSYQVVDPSLVIEKTYRLEPGSYELQCHLAIQNRTTIPMQVGMELQGPGGLTREEERQDTRKIITAYRQEDDIKTRLLESTEIRRLEREKIEPAGGFGAMLRGLFGKNAPPEVKLTEQLKQGDSNVLWAASTNKYFAAIVHPETGSLQVTRASFYDSSLMESEPAPQAGATFLLETPLMELAPAGQPQSGQSMTLSLYLGPKDRDIFDRNEMYRALQYFLTIDFRGCCCPVSVIAPMAFGIMWLMNTLYALMGPLGNYGIVIIFLVFLVRLILHPITKKSQVSMMGMQKLGPKMKEIQAKYANNKQEMNKQVMALYREAGISPVSGMLPMFLQMPIWIALWTAVNTSIHLRGAAFLPVWITDLASPDHLFRFPFGLDLPFFGEYFNLLPILMGVVMFLQQKMMPTAQTSAQTNPQMAQQQKMMMIMMPLMFPVLLYSGPSGVNLYILSSITAGVIEQKVIRRHLKEKEEAEAAGKVPVTAKTGGKAKKKKPKPFYKG